MALVSEIVIFTASKPDWEGLVGVDGGWKSITVSEFKF